MSYHIHYFLWNDIHQFNHYLMVKIIYILFIVTFNFNVFILLFGILLFFIINIFTTCLFLYNLMRLIWISFILVYIFFFCDSLIHSHGWSNINFFNFIFWSLFYIGFFLTLFIIEHILGWCWLSYLIRFRFRFFIFCKFIFNLFLKNRFFLN